MPRPIKRLDHVSELQWEVNAWLEHFIAWRDSDIPMHDAVVAKQTDALEHASQILFDAFGQPDAIHKAENDDD